MSDQLPNSAGIVEDPALIPPPPPVDPRSVNVPESTANFQDEEEE